MAKPVGLSFFGGLLIISGAEFLFGLNVHALKQLMALGASYDVLLGTLGRSGVIPLIPMRGASLSEVSGL